MTQGSILLTNQQPIISVACSNQLKTRFSIGLKSHLDSRLGPDAKIVQNKSAKNIEQIHGNKVADNKASEKQTVALDGDYLPGSQSQLP